MNLKLLPLKYSLQDLHGAIIDDIVESLPLAERHFVVSARGNGMLLERMARKTAGTHNPERISFNQLRFGNAVVEFIDFRKADKLQDRGQACVYIYKPVVEKKGKDRAAMMRLFSSWRDFRKFSAVIHCSWEDDGAISRIIGFNDGKAEFLHEPMHGNEVKGDLGVCSSCLKCVSFVRHSEYDGDVSFINRDDDSFPCRVVKTDCSQQPIPPSFDKFDGGDGLAILVNKHCHRYAEHFILEGNDQ